MDSYRLKPTERSLVQGPFSLDFSCFQLVDACGSQPNCWLQFLHSWDKQHASLNSPFAISYLLLDAQPHASMDGVCQQTHPNSITFLPCPHAAIELPNSCNSLIAASSWARWPGKFNYLWIIQWYRIDQHNLDNGLMIVMIHDDDTWWYIMIFRPLLLQACTCSHEETFCDVKITIQQLHPIQCIFLSVQSPSSPSSTACGMSAADAVQGPPLLHQLGPVEFHASVAVSVRVYVGKEIVTKISFN